MRPDPRRDPDFVFTHFRSRHPRALYVGQAVNERLLYPDQDGRFTVFVDHYQAQRSRRERVQWVLDQCRALAQARGAAVRIWYQTVEGIEEGRFDACRARYRALPFAEIAAYYRKTHVFLPTHRETQGMVAAEIGACGGLSLMRPWMYPRERRRAVPHRLYGAAIDWPERIDTAANRALALRNFGEAAFAERLGTALDRMLGNAL